MNEKETAKQRLINVTIDLIYQGKTPSEITVAEITEKAGVGNGMVNYHFQSKENLMKTAVRGVMQNAKQKIPEELSCCEKLSSKERLILILQETAGFFADNPEISRIAILDNLAEIEGLPHILSDVEVFNTALYELFKGRTNIIMKKNFLIAGFFNYIFLKAEVIRKVTGFDFYDKNQRNEAISSLVNEILLGNKLECEEEQ